MIVKVSFNLKILHTNLSVNLILYGKIKYAIMVTSVLLKMLGKKKSNSIPWHSGFF